MYIKIINTNLTQRDTRNVLSASAQEVDRRRRRRRRRRHRHRHRRSFLFLRASAPHVRPELLAREI